MGFDDSGRVPNLRLADCCPKVTRVWGVARPNPQVEDVVFVFRSESLESPSESLKSSSDPSDEATLSRKLSTSHVST